MLKIYLCDLIYDTIKTNYVVPLNVAYIATYVKEKYPNDVDISIFKYPKELERALRKSHPDIIGFSHYSWNSRLDIFFVEMVKRLNPNVITVMGGPNIRTERDDLRKYLSTHTSLDYYIVNEGEECFATLVGRFIAGESNPRPPSNCAGIVEGEFVFESCSFHKKTEQINLPSPYLTGILDEFLANPSMTPLLETNRGCPFGCVYCTWGIAALSKVRQRSFEVVCKEIDYVAENSAGQMTWIFCDANYGLLSRDVKIAEKIREVMDEKGYPVNIIVWYSKNTSKRNIEIAKILNDKNGLIAIQSADPEVLEKSGRGNIDIEDIKENVHYYQRAGSNVYTDVLIGLPGESEKSHLETIYSAFEMGFDGIVPTNIRLLPGSKYESDEYRQKFKVMTKYRPIFGAYGIYDGRSVFEIEESVRATKDMTEIALDSFKVLHWLIYLLWNTGICKTVLRFGQLYGINPGLVLHKLSLTSDPLLKNIFDSMRKRSMAEWFETSKEMIMFYEQQRNYKELLDNFAKLNFMYIAMVYSDEKIIRMLLSELIRILNIKLQDKGVYSKESFKIILDFTDKYICFDLLQRDVSIKKTYNGEVASIIFNDKELLTKTRVDIQIFRPKEYIKFCHFVLKPDGKRDLSLKNLCRFFEIEGALRMLTNEVRAGA